ncbi:MAG: macro domain-containing protein [Gemmatimonadales bacterium]|jgi:O-acetyl-ADP-ribose deacetylase (regulator of RNase III)
MAEATAPALRINQTDIRLSRDDITTLDVDAFVFYAQHDLALGSGYGRAISVRGGLSIQQELDGLGPLETCDAVVSAAGELPARAIIHAVGPRFSEEDLEHKLRRTMVNVLARAEQHDFRRLAFPPMGAGYYGIPPDLCATVMVDELTRHLQGDTCLDDVTICVLDTKQFRAFETTLSGSR